MPECYATKRGHQLEFDKPLHRGGIEMANFSVTHILNDLIRQYECKINWFFTVQIPNEETDIDSTGRFYFCLSPKRFIYYWQFNAS